VDRLYRHIHNDTIHKDTAKENIIKNEAVTKIGILQTELIQSKLSFETKIKTIENEKEREINHVYVRY